MEETLVGGRGPHRAVVPLEREREVLVDMYSSSSPISSIIGYYPYSTMWKTTTLSHSSVEVSLIMYISLHFYLNVTFIIHVIYSNNYRKQYISWCHHFREINYIVIKRFHQLNKSHMCVNTKLAWLSNKILRI
jgi:hypothetical protein